jgi:hypothetical protein
VNDTRKILVGKGISYEQKNVIVLALGIAVTDKGLSWAMDVAYKFRCPNPNLIKVQVIIYLSKPFIKE